MVASEEEDEWEQEEPDDVWTAERLCQATCRDLGDNPDAVTDKFLDHLLASSMCLSSLKALLTSSMSATARDHSLEINMFEMLSENPILGHLLLRYPSSLIPLLEIAIVKAQEHLQGNLEELIHTTVKGGRGNGKELPWTRIHARLVNLPPTCCRSSVANIQAQDVGKIVQVCGTVVRTSPVQMYESARLYKCTGKEGCSMTFFQNADLEERTNALRKPDRCSSTLSSGQRCKGTQFEVEDSGSVHTDYQELKIQEGASKIGFGKIPQSLLIKLEHDLVDKCQPGDEVVVVGSLLAQWYSPGVLSVDCNIGMAMKAHSIRVLEENGSSAWKSTEENGSMGGLDKFRKEFDTFWSNPKHVSKPIAARDFVCRSVCPKLYGLEIVKLGLLITLIGGVSSEAYKKSAVDVRVQSEKEVEENRVADADTEEGSSSQFSEHPVPFRVMDATPKNQPAYFGQDGSTSKQGKDTVIKTRRRDMSHMLIVGDPGTGKSQILRFAAALCPRSVLTTGVGTTSAGLTCAAVREGNGKEFALEAGALILADKGVCCIDEFGCIRKEDRTTIHEAMEQQTLSVAKAGIVCKLNCRATIIAVMNPRDYIYDNAVSLSSNTGLGTPLLSRFDIIFKLVDSPDIERDDKVTTFLLNRAIQHSTYDQCTVPTCHIVQIYYFVVSKSKHPRSHVEALLAILRHCFKQMSNQSNATQGSGLECTSLAPGSDTETLWTMEKLRAYISIVRDRFQPVIGDEAAMLLERHYEKIRSSQQSIIPITVRFLESLIRLSQAHARLMYRNVVMLEDAVAVLRVMECSAFVYGGFNGEVEDFENYLYADPMSMLGSCGDVDTDFLCFMYRILKRYDMVEYLSQEDQEKAQQMLNFDDPNTQQNNGPDGVVPDWNETEHPRDRTFSNALYDHYGRSYFDSPQNRAKRMRRR